MNINQLHKKILLKNIESFPLLNYEPANLREWPTGWHIEYRVLNPESGLIERKKIRFEKIRKRLGNDNKARRYAKLYCEAITEKLESGWNPYLEGKKTKSFQNLIDVLEQYINEKRIDLKNGVFREDSIRTYQSLIHTFFQIQSV